MQRYKVKLISYNSLPVGLNGVVEPLCERCHNGACGNPIQKVSVSVFGVKKEYKSYVSHLEPRAVIDCEGFTPNNYNDSDNEEEDD